MPSLLESLQSVLGSAQVLTGESIAERFPHIWKMHEPLLACALVFPRSTEELSECMRVCHRFDQTVVIHGGLTGLTGATQSSLKDVVISLERMNHIEEVDSQSRTMTVEAGVILEEIHQRARDNQLMFPLNFGAKGSAQIGGIIATNAGGLRVFRYGMTRQLVLGLEVVLADGTIISSVKKIIKDNSAYDLKHLFIGSEGTLGIVSRAVLKLVEVPKSRLSALVGLEHYDDVVRLLKSLDGDLAGSLSGFELIWNTTYRAMTSHPATMKPPLSYDYPYYVLCESLGSQPESDLQRFESALQNALELGIIQDAVVASSESELNWFWTIREDVGAFLFQYPHQQHFDISLPISDIGRVVENIIAELNYVSGVQKVFTFGHVADGNIHFIVIKDHVEESLTRQIDNIVYNPLKEVGGSISAEHGIGIDKKDYLHISRTSEEIALMKTLKSTLDPKGLLNPGRVLDI